MNRLTKLALLCATSAGLWAAIYFIAWATLQWMAR